MQLDPIHMDLNYSFHTLFEEWLMLLKSTSCRITFLCKPIHDFHSFYVLYNQILYSLIFCIYGYHFCMCMLHTIIHATFNHVTHIYMFTVKILFVVDMYDWAIIQTFNTSYVWTFFSFNLQAVLKLSIQIPHHITQACIRVTQITSQRHQLS